MITATISATEVVWVLPALLIAIPCHVWCVRFYRRRLRELSRDLPERVPSPPAVLSNEDARAWLRLTDAVASRADLTFLALVTTVRHTIKLSIQVAFLAAGVYQMTIPPANPATPITAGAIFTTAAVVYGQLALACIALLEVFAIRWLQFDRRIVVVTRLMTRLWGGGE